MREVLAARDRGVDPVILTLRASKEPAVHGDARSLLPRLRRSPYLSVGVLISNLKMFARSPARYLGCCWRVFRMKAADPAVLLKTLAIVPKSIGWAERLPREGVDHVHAQWATYPATCAWIIHELTGLPFSVSVHATDIRHRPVGQAAKFERAAFVATCSEYNVAYLRQTYPDISTDRWHRIYHGIDRDRLPFRREGRRERVILAVGRFDPTKGFTDLIEACYLLANRGHRFECRLAGWGEEENAYRRLIEDRSLGDRVRLIGPLTQEELAEHYAAATVLVQPSVPDPGGRGDVLPNVILEALACGLPVVTTPVAAIPEVVRDGETGVLVAPGDATALADSVERLLEDAALRDRLAHKGRGEIEARFDVSKNVEEFLRLVRAAVAERTASPRP